MISGVGSYSSYGSYSYASSSTSSSARPQGCGASGQNKAQEKLFSLLDANGDGGVAKDELATALESAKEQDSGLEIDLDELFSQLDANSDGAIDLDETAALAPPPPPPGGPNPEEMFSSIDTDGDGVLGLEELTSAIGTDSGLDVDALFGELDADGDGSLSQDEVAALAPPPPPPGQGTEGMQFGQSEESTGSSDDQGYGRLVAALLKQYEAGAAGYSSSRVGSQLSLSA
jgi:Ca2+-binding EF-hand superfamily protein